MKLNKNILIITMMIFVLFAVQNVNATTYSTDFSTSTGWSLSSATISGGVLTINSANPASASYGSFTASNYDIEFDYKPTSIGAEACFYVQVSPNHYMDFDTSSSFTRVNIQYGSSNTGNTVISLFSNGVTYHIRIMQNATGDYLFVNGILKASWNNPYLGNYNNNPIYFWTNWLTETIDNLYWADNSNPQPPASAYTLFTGTVKDSNGNPLQYANVTLWSATDGSSVINSTLTNSTGYYNLYNTTSNGYNYSLTVQPANQGYTNAILITDNSTITTYVNNFVATTVTLSLQTVDGDNINRQINNININFTKYAMDSSWISRQYFINAGNPWTYNGTLNLSDNVFITVNSTGYFSKSVASNALTQSNVLYVSLSENNTPSNYVLISGYTRDQQGYKISNITCWLEDNVNNVIDNTISDSLDGKYSLQVPKTPNKYYHVVAYYPCYGNVTVALYNTGATTQIGQTLVYPDTWTTYNWDVNQNLGVDLWLNINHNDFPTPTPTNTPSVNPVQGYYTIVVTTTDDNHNLISGIPCYIVNPDGTISSYTVTTGSTAYNYIYVPTTITAGNYKLKAFSNSQYTNATTNGFSSRWLTFPLSSQVTYVTLEMSNLYQQYHIHGYITDAYDYSNIANANYVVSDNNKQLIKNSFTTDGGTYDLYLNNNLPVGVVYFNITANGYQNAYYTIPYPDLFIQYGNDIRNDMPMYKTFATDAGTINFHVFGNDTGLPLNLVDIEPYWSINNTRVGGGGFTDSNGNCQFNINAGNYIFKLMCNGYQDTYYSLTVNPSDTKSITIKMNKKQVVTPNPSYSTVTPTPSNSGNNIGGFDLNSLDGTAWGLIVIVVCFIIGFVVTKAASGAVGLAYLAFLGVCIIPFNGATLWPQYMAVVGSIIAGVAAILYFNRGG